MRILLVEDEVVVALALSFALEFEGFDVTFAPNGRKALELLSTAQPDLIITDYMMPEMNGIEMLCALRRRKEASDVPAILMTAVPERAIRDQIDGTVTYLPKPVAERTLVNLARRLLGETKDRAGQRGSP